MKSLFSVIGTTIDLALIITGAITVINQAAGLSLTAGALSLAFIAFYFAIRLRSR